MKKIKITEENRQKIESAIEEVQQGDRVRLIAVDDIFTYIDQLQEKLNSMMYKKDQKGVIFEIDMHSHHFPNSYKYHPFSTQFRVELCSSGWFLISVIRDFCGDCGNKIIIPQFSEEQKKAIGEFMVKPERFI